MKPWDIPQGQGWLRNILCLTGDPSDAYMHTHILVCVLLKECIPEHCDVQYLLKLHFPFCEITLPHFQMLFRATRQKQEAVAGSGSKETANLTAAVFSLVLSVVGFAANAHSRCRNPELLVLVQLCSFPTIPVPQILVQADKLSGRLFQVIRTRSDQWPHLSAQAL